MARERLEDVEQLLVGGVVGQKVAEVDVAEARGGARERRAAAAGDAHVLRRVLRRHAAAIEAVVELGDGLAQLPEPGDRRVLLIVDGDADLVHARRRAGELAGLGLALAEVAPLGIGRREAALDRLGGDVDDAGAWNRTKCRNLVGHDGCGR